MAGGYKFGLNPAPEPPRLRFGVYLKEALLPAIPQTFGRANLFPKDGWGMYLNDILGDCTVAGAFHAISLWKKLAGQSVRFTNLDAQDDYYAITGGGDIGADIVQVAQYWQKTGFRDATAFRHSIAAYLAGDPANIEHLYAGCYLFGAVGLGVEIPSSAGAQFDNGEPWEPVDGDTIEGYHYVPLIDRMADGNGLIVTWGQAQEVTPKWLSLHLKEVVYYISQEELINGETPEGFNMEALEGDLAALGNG